MATKTRTYNTTDWSVWTLVPEAGSFVLDFSLLDGPDVLGSTVTTMAKLDLPIGAISLTEGGHPDSEILPTIQPANLTVTLSIKDFTRTDFQKFYVGKAIWLTLANAQTTGATTYGFDTPWFMGIIRDFQVTLSPGSDYADITIDANSNSNDWMNYQLSVTKNTTDGKDTVLNYALAADIMSPPVSWGYQTEESPYHYADTSTEIKTIGEWFADVSVSDQPYWRDEFFIYTSAVAGFVTYSPQFKGHCYVEDFSLTFDSTNITNIDYAWDASNSPSAVSLTNYKTPATVYNNQKSAGVALGSVNFSSTVDVKNLAEMTTIGQRLISLNKSFAVTAFTHRLATDNQPLIYRDIKDFDGAGTSHSAWLYPYDLAKIGEEITIDLPDYGFDPQTSVVVGRTLEVNYTDTLVTYQLWKGLTY